MMMMINMIMITIAFIISLLLTTVIGMMMIVMITDLNNALEKSEGYERQ